MKRNEIHSFMDNCVINPSTKCWEWQGFKDRDGYGQISYKSKAFLVHRIAYMFYHQLNEDDISNRVVMHLCDNPSCVNPDHLKLGTQQENIIDMHKKGRAPNRSGENNPNAKLTDFQVQKIKELYALGISQEELAKMFNVSRRTIHNIRKGVTWSHTQPLNG